MKSHRLSLLIGVASVAITAESMAAAAQRQTVAAELSTQPTNPTGEATTGAAPGVETPVEEVARDAATEDSAGEIVVTARGRQETFIDVPVAVSVIGPQAINRNLALDLSKIGELTPTVIVGAYKSNAGGSIAIRGISSPANQAGFEQAVSVAVDGVQTSDGRIAQLGFFDVAQVEVLKGPQALFFGKNSPAGVISLKTADPTSSFEISGRGIYEFVGDEIVTEGAVSGPLGSGVGARLAIRYRNLDGWLRNSARPLANPFYNPATGAPAAAGQLPGASDPRPGDKELLGRFTLRAEVAPALSARLKVFGAKSQDEGPGVATQNIGPCVGPNPRYAGIPDSNAECRPDRNTTIGDVPPVIAATMRGGGDGSPYGRLRAFTTSLDLELDLGAGTLASTTGYNWIRYKFFSGLDQTTFSQLAFFNDQANRALSQELRYVSKFESPFNFVIGGYFQDTELNDTNDVKLNDRQFNAAANRYVLYEDLNRQDGSTLSAFAQALYEITDDLEFSAGARWTRERKTFSKQNLFGQGTFNTRNANFPGSDEVGVLKGKFKDENISPEVSLTWRPGQNRTLYIAYKTGFKSGGFGLTSPLQTSTRIGDVDYESEKARGFELGAKGLFLDNALRISSTAFAYNFKDLQVNTFDPSRIAFTINNAGSVRQRGAEVEANLRVSEYLSLHSAVAYVHNRFRNFIGQCYGFAFPPGTTRATATPPPGCSFVNMTALTLQQDFSGRAPARSPDWSGNAGFEVEVPFGDMKLGFTGDAFYSDSYFAAETMAPSTLQDSFWRFNASARIASADDRWSLSLVGRNLSNKYYLLYAADRTGGTGVPGVVGEQRGVVARGREVALQAAFRF